jgi:RNA polymerase sigma-B factor
MADHRDVRRRFEAFRATGDRRIRDGLIEDHRWIAVHCARRFAGRGEPMADLVQVGQLGVVKAVERYDPAYEVHFATFAVPTVLGELRRHFRDATWPVHVPRRMKELHLELAATVDVLHQDLGRAPTVPELAERMAVTEEDVLFAMEANAAYRSAPLSPPSDRDGGEDDSGQEGCTLGVEELDYGRVETAMLVRRLLRTLPERERRIVELRFFEERTQLEIGRQVGLSQVHVSRVLRTSLDRLHRELALADRGPGTGASRPGNADELSAGARPTPSS